MKDQILAIEPNDDLALLRDRIMRAQGDRILLHLAPTATLARLDIALARRWAEQIGAHLIVVSTDKLTASEARKAGVDSHPTIDQALASTSIPPQSSLASRIPPRPGLGNGSSETSRNQGTAAAENLVATRIQHETERDGLPTRDFPHFYERSISNLIFVAPIALIAVTALLWIPRAKVIVALPVHAEHLRAPIGPSLVSRMSTEVAVSRSVASSGRMLVPSSPAIGELSLYNRGGTLLAIPPGTRFLDPVSKLEFETQEGVWLDPLATVVVEIRAVIPGSRGNLPAGRIREASGMPEDRLEVQQITPTFGGLSEWRAAVTSGDLRTLRESARLMLSREAEDALAQQASDRGLMLVAGSLLVLDPHETVSAPAGTAVDEASLTLSARVEAQAVSNQDVLVVAGEAAQANAEGRVYLVPNEDEIRVLQDAEGRVEVEFTLQIFPTALPSNAARYLTFRTRSGAQNVIQSLLPASHVHIESSPAWWPLMPSFPLRIEMRLAPAAEIPRVVR